MAANPSNDPNTVSATMPAPPPGATGDGLYDAKGRWVPARLIKEVDIARDAIVRELATKAVLMSKQLAAFKSSVMNDIQAFCQLSAQEYGAELGGTKGNVTLTTYDGRFKVIRATADHLTFDERLLAAKKLIDECINEWATGSSDEIRLLVNDAFQVDKTGKVSTERVLGLRKVKIEHAKWKKAMEAISDSVQVAATRSYVRIYERVGDSDEYRAIPLDISSV
jgi:hypothetical protein